MYIVIGSDNLLYGPVEVEVLKQWIRIGSVSAGTVLIDTRNDQQVLAGQVPALRDHFPAQPAPTASATIGSARHKGPPTAGGTVNPGQAPYPSAGAAGQQSPYETPRGPANGYAHTVAGAARPAKRTRGANIAGIVALVVLVGLFGLVQMLKFAGTLLVRSRVPRSVALQEAPSLMPPEGVAPQSNVYFVPVNGTPQATVDRLAAYYSDNLRIHAESLPRLRVPLATYRENSRQVAADDMGGFLRGHYPEHAGDCIIGVIDTDIGMRDESSNYVFSLRWPTNGPGAAAIISTARLNPQFYGDPPDSALEWSRLRKLSTKMIGFLCYKLPPSADPESPLTNNIQNLGDIDRVHQAS